MDDRMDDWMDDRMVQEMVLRMADLMAATMVANWVGYSKTAPRFERGLYLAIHLDLHLGARMVPLTDAGWAWH